MKYPEKNKAMPITKEAMIKELQEMFCEVNEAYMETKQEEGAEFLLEKATELRTIISVSQYMSKEGLKLAVKSFRVHMIGCYSEYWKIIGRVKYENIRHIR